MSSTSIEAPVLEITNPFVSILMPTYNQAHFIRDAIESVLRQQHTNFELIIVDNASTDNTANVVGEFIDDRIQYIRNQKNIGMVANFRKALEHSSGDYVCFLSSDDWIEPQFLNWATQVLDSHRECVFAFCGVNTFGISNKQYVWPLPEIIPGREFVQESLSRGKNLVHLCSCLARRHNVSEVGIEPLIFFDWTLWLRLALRGSVAYTPRLLANYRIHGNNETRQSLSSIREHYSALRQSVSAFSEKEGPTDNRTAQVKRAYTQLYRTYTALLTGDLSNSWQSLFSEIRKFDVSGIDYHQVIIAVLRAITIRIRAKVSSNLAGHV